MKQQSFEDAHEKSWQSIDSELSSDKIADRHFPKAFRELCHQLALAKSRRYSPQLVDRLNELVIKAHHRFYRHSRRFHLQWLDFLISGFPCAIRRNRLFVYIALAIFLVPLFGIGITCYQNEEFIYSFSGADQVRSYESMYDPSNRKIGRERDSGDDLFMFGFYIKNNIGISFRTFAGGVIFGLGSVFFLFYNGLAIGGVAGHLTQLGYTGTFYPFVVGHGAFELTAIVFSGAAGLQLGYSLINPGRLSRLNAFRQAGRDAVIIIYGSTLMLILAAFLEAFWSSSASIPTAVKYTVGAFFWILVLYYFAVVGRANEKALYGS